VERDGKLCEHQKKKKAVAMRGPVNGATQTTGMERKKKTWGRKGEKIKKRQPLKSQRTSGTNVVGWGHKA